MPRLRSNESFPSCQSEAQRGIRFGNGLLKVSIVAIFWQFRQFWQLCPPAFREGPTVVQLWRMRLK
jgi:hypothetical protein